jgi:microcystin-dependent protein
LNPWERIFFIPNLHELEFHYLHGLFYLSTLNLISMDPTLAEIRLFAGNFAPLSWAFCNGALMSIAENTALFSLLGTTYGGDGQVTFALPDFRGRVPIGTGQGAGLSAYDLGQVSGTEGVTLISTQLPTHNHVATASAAPLASTSSSSATSPIGNFMGTSLAGDLYSASHNTNMGASTITVTVQVAGGSQPHDNLQPYLALYYIIAVEGIYPSRN